TTWNQFADEAAAGHVSYLKSDVNSSSVTFSTEADRGHKETIGVPTPHQMDLVIASIPATAGTEIDGTTTGSSPWWSILEYILPFVLIFGFWIFLMNQVQGGGSKVMSFGKSRAKRLSVDSPKI